MTYDYLRFVGGFLDWLLNSLAIRTCLYLSNNSNKDNHHMHQDLFSTLL